MSCIIYPLVFATGKKLSFILEGLVPFNAYQVIFLPVREKKSEILQTVTADSSGRLAWEQEIHWQGEASVDVFSAEEKRSLATMHVFATTPEIAARRPVRCDFHLHTTNSDGKDSVEEMVLCGREHGLDVIAITDHNMYAPSIEGIGIAQRLGMSLICLPGEEITSPTWHLLSIGASEGIGKPEQEEYAGLRWAIERVHQLGGKAYLAHPYWSWNHRYNQPALEYEQVLIDGGLDGIELLGEVPPEENMLSLARYYDLDIHDRPPILGNSDTHDMNLTFGAYWTLVFTRKLTPESILEAIQEQCSVACQRMFVAPPVYIAKQRLIPFGSYELVDLAYFLDTYYFPLHDNLCRREAEAARKLYCGEALPAEEMQSIRWEIENHYQTNWRS